MQASVVPLFALPNDRDQRLATEGLTISRDFIASPLHRLVRHAIHRAALFAQPIRVGLLRSDL